MSQLEQFLWRVQRQDNLQYETEISATEPTVAPSDGQPIITSATIILESRFIDNRFEGWINNESSLADPLAVQLNAIDPAGGISLSSGSEGVRVSATNSSPAQSGLLRIFDEGGTESIGITVPSTVTSRTHTIPDTSNDTFVMTNATQTLANKTLTDPRIGNTIFDTNGTELLTFSPTGSAVNEILITNAATGNDPSIIGAGDDANVGLILQSKGTGTIRVASQDAGVSGELRILDNTGGQYVGLTVPGALAGAYTLQLPTDVGTLGQVLSTDGNNPANLSWIDSSSTVTLDSTAGGQSLVFDGTGPDLTIRSLLAGTGIALGLNGNAVEITNTSPGAGTVTLDSTGTGANLVNDGTGPDLAIKSVTAGTGISIVENADDIIITNDDPGSGVTLASTVGDQSLVSDGTGPSLEIRALNAGTGISFAVDGNGSVTVTNTSPGAGTVTLDSTGTGANLVNDGTGPDLAIKSVTAGSGISIVENVDDIIITNDDPGSGVTLASTAGDQSLVSDGVGPDLQVRALDAGVGITLSLVGDAVEITNNDPGSAVTLTSTGTGADLVNDGTGPDLIIKSVTAGTGISIIENVDDIVITNDDPASGVTLSSTVGDQSLVSDGTGPDLAVRALNAGTGISFAVDGNGSVTITNTSPGGGTVTLSGIACSPPFSPSNEVNLVVNGTGPDLEIRNLNGGDGISLDINNDCVNITNTDPGSGTMDTVTTANNVMTTITTIPTTTDTTYFIDARLVARRTDSGTESAGYKLYATYRNNGGTLTQVGNDDLLSQEDSAQWDVDTVVSGTNILIQVMGQNGKTIDWKSSWMTISV